MLNKIKFKTIAQLKASRRTPLTALIKSSRPNPSDVWEDADFAPEER